MIKFTANPLVLRCLLLLLSSLLSLYVTAQRIDTIYRDGQVLLRSNIIVTFDSAFWAQHLLQHADTATVIPLRTAERGQQSNCGVVASFNPPGDSAFNGVIGVTFTSTSTNATALQWIVDGFNYGTGQTITVYFSNVGLTEVRLVAKNGGCTDTTSAYYLLTGTPPAATSPIKLNNYGLPNTEEFATALARLPQGGYLFGGYSTGWRDNFGDRGLVVKLKESGCVEWTKLFDYGYRGRVSAVKSLKDSGFLVALNGYQATTLFRFDKTGATVWKKRYSYASLNMLFTQLLEGADGSLYAAAQHADWNGFYVSKLTPTGDPVWTKHYQKAQMDMAGPLGMAEMGTRLFVAGYIRNPNTEVQYNSEYNQDGFIVCLNTADGGTVWSKMYGAIGSSDFFQDVQAYGSNLLVSSIRSGYLSNTAARHTYHFIDTSGTVLKSRLVQSPDFLQFPFKCAVVPFGTTGLYLTQGTYRPMNLQPGYTYKSYLQKVDTSDAIHWQSVTGSLSRQKFWFSTLGANNSLAMLGEQPNSLVKVYAYTSNFLFARIDSAGPSLNNCIYGPATNTIIPDTIVGFSIPWLKDTVFNISVSDAVGLPQTTYTEMRYQCTDYVDSCIWLRVAGDVRLCNLNQSYTYRAAKTRTCGLPVSWKVPAGVQVVSTSDTALVVRFPASGSYTIGAALETTCNPTADSIRVVAASAGASLYLGADTTLCSGTSIQLRAGNRFVSYRWQDNSVDSTYTVTAPGSYWVTVADSCGNILSDTISIAGVAAVPINIGPDRTKCNNDTVQLQAPAGFLNYSWSNNYNINSTTAQSVVVNPMVDTAYFIKAEKTPGCFAYDTVRITVRLSPPINLGPDRSFCSGDTVVLDAGAGFAAYAWNGGAATTQQLHVAQANTYWVTGTTAEGCKSRDTFRVTAVHPLPAVRLDRDEGLCTGLSKTLNAGNFAGYRWSTGATTPDITVSGIGQYAVEVTDANGCTGRDTTAITIIYPLPMGFLPVDTAICSYGTIQLKPGTAFTDYRWSNGASTPAITIAQPGTYWLIVTDANTCRGRDSVVVNPKQCMTGFYAPTAFTPNADNRNDVFQPMIFGVVKQYRLTVYNRWGQPVFTTTVPQKGWDGTIGGVLQSTGAYVWLCQYQLQGEEAKTEKGTVMLIW